MRDKVKNTICCPECYSNLVIINNKCKCNKCFFPYSIINGVPALIEDYGVKTGKIDEIISGENKYSWVKKIYKLITISHTFKSKGSKERIPQILSSMSNDNIVINIGAGNTRYSDDIINIDIELTDNVDVIADSRKLPINDSSVDLIISQAVLEHTPDTIKNIQEMKRVLKKGGLIYCEVPFMQTYHAHPHDYFRFTHAGLKDIFKNFTIEDEGIAVGPASAFSLSFRMFISTLFSFGNKRLFIFIGIVANWLTFPLKYFDYFLEKSKLAHFMASGIYILARKKE